MGKWDQLEKEFDEILNSMTQEDWERWDKEREQNAANRRREMDMAAAQLTARLTAETDAEKQRGG